MAASWLQAGWLKVSGMALAQDALLAGAGKRPWEGRGSRLPAHPSRVCEGAGHMCPANNCGSHPPAKSGFRYSLPAFLAHLPFPSTVLQLRIHRRNQDCSKCGPPWSSAPVPKEHTCPQIANATCQFQRTQESVGPPHPLSFPTPGTLILPWWSRVSQPLPHSVACPFPWSQGIQTPPGPVPGIR